MRSIILLVCTLSLCAQTAAPRRVGVGAAQRRLTLKQALEMALGNNLELEIEKTNTAVARVLARGAFGAFDPTLRYATGWNQNTTPTPSVLQAADGRLVDKAWNNNFAFVQKLPWNGLTAQAQFLNGRLATTNPFVGLNPFYNTSLSVGLTQPLLRGRATDPDRTNIRIRRKNVEISDADFELRVIDVAVRVQEMYWNLVAARQDVAVSEEAVRLAQTQLELNQRQIAAGTLARVELPAAEAELERRRDTYFATLNVLTQVENALKALLTGNRAADLWNDELIPVEDRTVDPPPVSDLESAVGGAIRKRPELRALALRQDSTGLQKQLAKDQTRPGVNLNAGYIVAGLGGPVNTSPNPFSSINAPLNNKVNEIAISLGLAPLPPATLNPPPASFIGGYGTSLSNVFNGNYPTFQVGMSFDWTVRNRAAEASLQQVALTERQLKLQQAQLEQGINLQVRNALQTLDTAKARITAAEASARAAQEKLESETRLFQAGESTNFLVLTRQNELSDSRRRAVLARLEFNRAVARLEQALGVTLDAHAITLP